ncbi:MAG: endonuclease [Flavobacteriales bacterium]|nr:endonuclease [Flavobacteriales bacterium]
MASKRGPCSWPGCSGTVFEPIDAYKGDSARGYFYMLTRYMNGSVSWPAPIVTGGQLFSWTELAGRLAYAHPVSAKEIARNDSAFILQGNRNPYIDNPMGFTASGVRKRDNDVHSASRRL